MRPFSCLPTALLLLLALSPTDAQARRRRHGNPTPAAAVAADPAPVESPQPPAGLVSGPPSERVLYFLNAYLESAILVPLDSPIPPPRQALSALLLSLNNDAPAAPPGLQPAFRTAVSLGNTLSRLCDDRLQRLHALLSPFQTATTPDGTVAASVGVAPTPAPASPAASGLGESHGESPRRTRVSRQRERRARQLPGTPAAASNRLLIVQRLREWLDDCTHYRAMILDASAKVRAAEVAAGNPGPAGAPGESGVVPPPAAPAAPISAATTVVASPRP